jgi:hypothetical protein
MSGSSGLSNNHYEKEIKEKVVGRDFRHTTKYSAIKEGATIKESLVVEISGNSGELDRMVKEETKAISN